MADKTWKKVERKIAELIGGRRVPVTGRQRGDAPDIAHDWLSVEVKHRRILPDWILDALCQAKASAAGTDKLPIAILHQKHKPHDCDLVVITLADFRAHFGAVLPEADAPTVDTAENPHGRRVTASAGQQQPDSSGRQPGISFTQHEGDL
jgi:hypothetical protein